MSSTEGFVVAERIRTDPNKPDWNNMALRLRNERMRTSKDRPQIKLTHPETLKHVFVNADDEVIRWNRNNADHEKVIPDTGRAEWLAKGYVTDEELKVKRAEILKRREAEAAEAKRIADEKAEQERLIVEQKAAEAKRIKDAEIEEIKAAVRREVLAEMRKNGK